MGLWAEVMVRCRPRVTVTVRSPSLLLTPPLSSPSPLLTRHPHTCNHHTSLEASVVHQGADHRRNEQHSALLVGELTRRIEELEIEKAAAEQHADEAKAAHQTLERQFLPPCENGESACGLVLYSLLTQGKSFKTTSQRSKDRLQRLMRSVPNLSTPLAPTLGHSLLTRYDTHPHLLPS